MITTELILVVTITTDPGTGGDQNGTPRIAGFCTHYESSRNFDRWMHPRVHIQVEIFIDSDTGIEQRLLVGAVQLAGEWERELDAVGSG